jgi:carbon storage regulator CsrA
MARRNAMLVLTRKAGERIVIGNSIVVTVLETAKKKIRVGISAPNDIPISREELSFNSEESDNFPPALLRTEESWAEASDAFLG